MPSVTQDKYKINHAVFSCVRFFEIKSKSISYITFDALPKINKAYARVLQRNVWFFSNSKIISINNQRIESAVTHKSYSWYSRTSFMRGRKKLNLRQFLFYGRITGYDTFVTSFNTHPVYTRHTLLQRESWRSQRYLFIRHARRFIKFTFCPDNRKRDPLPDATLIYLLIV